MNRREVNRLNVIKAIVSWVLGGKRGRMSGKSIVALAVVGLVVLAGFIAYRLLAVELIANLRD
ncbi:hypothetical protein [Rhizohabitans arisaemae]|uniref:hypothetical protein n=1 Tax=Rhizohabitans arisaemae TaxID=2720610 RepID=UPI0024B0A43D|nr:hypothetical protein [Rhizohabitans arisaemae]